MLMVKKNTLMGAWVFVIYTVAESYSLPGTRSTLEAGKARTP
jgi:hypothetical protein